LKRKKITEFSKNLKIFFKIHNFLKIFFGLEESPMVSLRQEPLGGENHSQKTSKSGGIFPENHFLLRGIPFGKMKRQKNYKIFKKFCNFEKNALLSVITLHNLTPGRPKITARNQKNIKFSAF